MAFNSRQYEWAEVTVILGGKDLLTIRAIKYKKTSDNEALHAKGRNAISIQRGNVTVEGEVSILQSELMELEESAPNKDILQLALDMEVSYLANGVLRTDRVTGIRFGEYEKSLTQGDKFMEIPIPFLALDVVPGV
ncbi:hypothetical protein [Brumimicrobium mesophilum]|uniref:hypothetical protein n=1 Tax=Brumimicrobium mesophilum TaxID=392717 RepID=UPI000D13ED84|nr:hypothetical protein [Brumimicrobium mesophilum]